MKAVVYRGPGELALEDRPRPSVQAPTDAIVRISKTTICGTDMTIRRGGVPSVTPGRVIGHEGVGSVEAVGTAVTTFRPGDRVLISCITACGTCTYCRQGMFSSCEHGGWILGNTIDGCQAEFVRVPYAENGLYHIPDCVSDEAALMLADIVPTGLEVGVMNGDVKFGDVVAIVGAGPVGLAALLTVQFYGPTEIIVVDIDANRLALAKTLGATTIIDNRDGTAVTKILALTNGRGVDAAIEAAATPVTCKLVQDIIGVGGTIASVGVYSQSTELHKELLWTRNITIRMGVVNTSTIPRLIRSVQNGKLDPCPLITHRLPFADVLTAYDIFANAAREKAVKIVLSTEAAPDPTLTSAEQALVEQLVVQLMQHLTTR